MKNFILKFLTKRFKFYTRYFDICPSWIRIWRWQWTNGFVYQSDVMNPRVKKAIVESLGTKIKWDDE